MYRCLMQKGSSRDYLKRLGSDISAMDLPTIHNITYMLHTSAIVISIHGAGKFLGIAYPVLPTVNGLRLIAFQISWCASYKPK